MEKEVKTMSKVLLLSERTIKGNSIIEENIETKLVRITLKEVQDLDLMTILGEKLYLEVENEYIQRNNDKTYEIEPSIKLLMDNYIKDFLIYAVLLNIPNSLNYKYTNKGTTSLTDTNATQIGGNIENVKRFYRVKYDAYRLRLIEYVNKCNGVNNTAVASYSTGWYLKQTPDVVKIAEAQHYKTGRR